MPEQPNDIIHQWEKNKRESVRVSLSEYRDRELIDIRAFYTNEAGELAPTKKGISIGVEQLPELEKAVARLRERVATSVP